MRRLNSYKLTLIAMLAALAIAGRIALMNVPNVQPVTVLIIITALILGIWPALLLSLVVTFVTNLLLGMGIWSIWQVICWAVIGTISGLLSRYLTRGGLVRLIIFAVFCGYLYGLLISIPTYQIAGKFWPYYIAGLPFDTNHAIGNGLMMAFLYKPLSGLMRSYEKKYWHN